MDASIRVISSSGFNLHFSNPTRPLNYNLTHTHSFFPKPGFGHILLSSPAINVRSLLKSTPTRCSFPYPSAPLPTSNPLGLVQPVLASLTSDSLSPSDSKDELSLGLEGVHRGNLGIVWDKRPAVTVVLLGWLGAKPEHLKRYVQFYTSRGIRAVTFVVSVKELLWFDLGRRAEERVSQLAQDLAWWLSEEDRDGRERFLLFHTFSNTGWLVYGAILDNLEGREDLLVKIKGCVVDSGGDQEKNPQVWAAGFTAALLKSRSSFVYTSTDTGEGTENGVNSSKMQQKTPSLVETLLLFVFRMFFSFLLKLPDVNRRFMKTISTLSWNQPPCPQLYLYSTNDKVVPYKSIELFIDGQRRMGRKAWSFNFGSSPHVGHHRAHPVIYSFQLRDFLKVCLAIMIQT